MKKEREIIEKENSKKKIVIVLVLSLISLPACFISLKNPDFRWFGIFFVSGIIFAIILSLILLIILPKYSIVKDGKNLIVWQGIFKKVLPIETILCVEIVQLQKGKEESKHGNIAIKTKDKNGQETTFNIGVRDEIKVVEQLNAFINKSNC